MSKSILNCGIYQIKNLITGDLYVGQSVNLNKRKRDHFSKLIRGLHYNRYLQHSFDKYGKENFELSAILYCEPSELTYYEQKLVDLWKPVYNLCKECVDSQRGIKRSEETLVRMSEVQKGVKRSEETRIKMSKAHIGLKDFEETRLKISMANKGNKYWLNRKHSEETKQKMSKSQTGRVQSEETRQKISNSKLGKTASEKSKLKMSLSHKGKKQTEEHKRRRFESYKNNRLSRSVDQ